MSSANTGFWAAFGTVVGGVAGAFAGRYAAIYRPRARYSGGGTKSADIEDAMVIGGATGAVVGAFIAGTAAGEEPPKQLR